MSWNRPGKVISLKYWMIYMIYFSINLCNFTYFIKKFMESSFLALLNLKFPRQSIFICQQNRWETLAAIRFFMSFAQKRREIFVSLYFGRFGRIWLLAQPASRAVFTRQLFLICLSKAIGHSTLLSFELQELAARWRQLLRCMRKRNSF